MAEEQPDRASTADDALALQTGSTSVVSSDANAPADSLMDNKKRRRESSPLQEFQHEPPNKQFRPAQDTAPNPQHNTAHHRHGTEHVFRKKDRYHPYPQPSIAREVAEHYNQHRQQTPEQRRYSPIYRLRNFNNWIKSVLISRAVRDCRPEKVLDMGCGKGGDLLKWSKARIKYLVGVDIAEVSIEQARGRWKEMRHNRFDAEFHALDCYQNPLSMVISPDMRFDIVSQQFCLHYAFETEAKAKQMVANVADYLRPGGYWIGTLPDAYWITKKLKSIEGLSFGNSVYRITFDQKDHYPTYGHRYIFHLEDAIESCPEYLVHFPTLVRLAEERGLKLIQRVPFHIYYEKAVRTDPEAVQLLRRMKVIENGGSRLSDDEWEAAVFVFVKSDKQ